MPLIDKNAVPAVNHLDHIIADIQTVTITRGELERLRALEREARALKEAALADFDGVGQAQGLDESLAGCLFQGATLAPLLRLV